MTFVGVVNDKGTKFAVQASQTSTLQDDDLQVLVKIGPNHLVLHGSSNSVVLEELSLQWIGPGVVKPSAIILISRKNARVLRSGITFAEVSPWPKSLYSS